MDEDLELAACVGFLTLPRDPGGEGVRFISGVVWYDPAMPAAVRSALVVAALAAWAADAGVEGFRHLHDNAQ